MTWSIPNPLQSAALARPDHPALLVAGGRAWSYAALLRAVQARAAAWAAAGVEPLMRVALRADLSERFVIDLHALGMLGAVALPYAPLDPPEALRASLAAREAQALLHASPPGPLDELGLRTLALPTMAEVCACFGGDPARQAAPLGEERFWALDEPRAILTTSGTTGDPKPVVLTTGQLVFSAFGSAARLGHALDDRWLCCLPLHHVGGLSILLRCAWGATTVALHRRFDPAAVARALDEGEVTLASLVPEMLRRVLDLRPAKPFHPAVRAVLLGGAPASEALLERCRALQLPVSLTWGMSETASQVCTRAPGDFSEPVQDVGAPLAFARVSSDEHGRLSVRGPIAPGSRLETSDRGALTDEGRVRVWGRADDALISGGENIDPAEIEAVLLRHPLVREAVVFGVPDARWGQRPVALVVGGEGLEAGGQRPPGPLSLLEAENKNLGVWGTVSPRNKKTLNDLLRAWCAEHLPVFKIPDEFCWCEALPSGGELGKRSRAALRRWWQAQPQGGDHE